MSENEPSFNVISSWSRTPRVHLGIMIEERRAPACWQYDHVPHYGHYEFVNEPVTCKRCLRRL